MSPEEEMLETMRSVFLKIEKWIETGETDKALAVAKAFRVGAAEAVMEFQVNEAMRGDADAS